jgi:ribosomal protein S18 acetylase RimI-like enzyme
VTVHVRAARGDEAQATAALVESCYVGEGLVSAHNPYVHELRDGDGRFRQADLLVAQWEDALVGTVTWCPPGSPWREIAEPGEGEFRMLAVHPQARGRGVGRALVQACLQRAQQGGERGVVISTIDRMVDARRLYEALGFVRAPHRDWWPRPTVHLWVYQLDLADRAERPAAGDGRP